MLSYTNQSEPQFTTLEFLVKMFDLKRQMF